MTQTPETPSSASSSPSPDSETSTSNSSAEYGSITILTGAPATGKSGRARAWLIEAPNRRIVGQMDDALEAAQQGFDVMVDSEHFAPFDIRVEHYERNALIVWLEQELAAAVARERDLRDELGR